MTIEVINETSTIVIVTGEQGPAGVSPIINGKSGPMITLDAEDVGAAPVDGQSRVPLANLQVRTAQVTRAARPVLVTEGGTFSGFLATCGGPDATDGSWEAIYVEGFAPINGVLYGALNAYLQGLGLSPSQASSQLATIWQNALSISP